MWIDIIFVILMIMALFKGLSRGFIVAVFSLFAFIIGLAAAIKLSAVVSVHLQQNTNVSGKWLPIISFLLVFLLVVFLVRLGARWIEKTIEFAWLGWLNRLLGIILYAVLYITLFSIFLFYAVQINFIKPETIASSRFYDFISPWGPYAINGLGKLIPWFRDMFTQLENFFGSFSKKI